MARWAIGDLQGCCDEFQALLRKLRFNPDRDRLWLTGDLVNRGPRSLEALRLVHAMRANLVTVLGNHDLHLLALAFDPAQKPRKLDTLDAILAAPDRAPLLDWLLQQPLAHFDGAENDLLVHAGLVPQWTVAETVALAGEVSAALRRDPVALFAAMYGDQPDTWRPDLRGADRLRFVINVLTRLRACDANGRINLKFKAEPAALSAPWLPWFSAPKRASAGSRVVCGHWSALGFVRTPGLVALDTGCVWGGALTAVNLDDDSAPAISVPSRQPVSRE
jgi:bis(5'-nucleosyl)-tetraphosphatase (symmetrical)